jgi:hypothetical protein
MSDAKGNSRSTTSRGDREVLVNLPQTRPQRSSPRRAAARAAAAGTTEQRRPPARSAARSRIGGGTAQGGSRKSATARTAAGKPTSSAPKASAGSARRRSPKSDRSAPRQGFESEGENMNGSVQPPGGAELVASAAEIVGELAKVGLSAGERLLKDAFSRLPRS